MSKNNIDPDIINLSKVYHEEKEHYNPELENKINEYMLPIEEYSDICVKCQQRHFNTKGFDKDGNFPVDCKGIPRSLDEDNYYPLEMVYGDDYEKLTMEEKVQLQYKNNVLLWAEHMLNWTPYNPKRKWYQYYQKEILLCTSLRKVCRLGRRMGKSEILALDSLHYGMTTFIKNPHVLIIAPFMNLCDELYSRFIDKLDDSAFSGIYSSTKKPYTITIPRSQYNDVCTIKLFTTGSGSGNAAASVRGQSADSFKIDEAGYTDQQSLEAILPLALEHPEVPLVVTSTPSQMPNKFKEWCLQDKDWKDFHYPFTIMPNFEPGQKEYEEFKKMYSKQGWKQEIEAEFFEGNAKVFKTEDIETALQDYKYAETHLDVIDFVDWVFVIGVDWNTAKHGVQIVLLGINMTTLKVKVWKRVSISNQTKGLQLKAINEIVRIDKEFNAYKIMVDQGYGAAQIEILTKHYQRFNKEEKIVPIDFGSSLTFKHPITKESYSRRIKCEMVANLQQRFEYETIILSRTDDGDIPSTDDREGKFLTTQLDNYEIEKYDNRNNPVFKASGPGTDHALDALLLANYGINVYVEKIFNTRMGHRASFGNKSYEDISDEITDYLKNSEYTLKDKYKSNGLRSNFAEVYNNKAIEEEISDRLKIAQSGGINKIWGTSRKRLSRRSFR